MSGFEVAGIVLGTLPLVVTALEAYINFLADWGKAPSELKSLNRQLTTERSKLYNVCDQLLGDVVPQRDIEPMLQNPFGPLWKTKETNSRIRRRLWNSYASFETTVTEVGEALDSVTERLSVQVEWMSQGRMTREFKKFLYRLNRKDYQDALGTISRGISDLEGLARLSVTLEPSRRRRSRGRVFNILRDLSTSIYRALRSGIQCSDSHDVSLELSTRFIEVGYEDEDDEVLRHIKFTIAISFQVADGTASRRFWDEVNIKAAPASRAPSPSPIPGKRKEKGVSFALTQTISFISHPRPRPSSESTAAGLAPIEAASEALGPPVDLCMAVRKSREARPVCYGHLTDEACTNRNFRVYPLGTTTDSDTWSVVTLHDVLEHKKGLPPLVSLAQRVRLALAIASSVLQLSKTPWLTEELTSKNVHFFRRGECLSYQSPFLLRSLPECSLQSLRIDDAVGRPGNMLMNNTTLFALGILLLEIILGSTLDQLRERQEDVEFAGDELGVIRDSITARRLLEQKVSLISPSYKTVVERCMGCTAGQSLDQDDFRHEVYNSVVLELETIWECTTLSI